MNLLLIPLIVVLGGRASYQQTLSKELSFCLNEATPSNTLQTFWQDASRECEFDPKLLIDQYRKVTQIQGNQEDRCNLLLIHHMRKRLIHAAAQQLEEAFIVGSLRGNNQLNRLLEEIHNLDEGISEAVWERALCDIYLFVEQKEIVAEIVQLSNAGIQVIAFQILLSKNNVRALGNQNILPLITYSVSKQLKSRMMAPASLEKLYRLYHRLPLELRFFYNISKTSVAALLNRAHWEYLYVPHDNGPDHTRRVPLTWSQEKNVTDTEGQLLVDFNSEGLVAFASRFEASLKYLYADEELGAPYFWIGPGTKANRWWRVIWPDDSRSKEGERAIALQNDKTGEFLCATTAYDKSRRYVILLSGLETAERHDCWWMVSVCTEHCN